MVRPLGNVLHWRPGDTEHILAFYYNAIGVDSIRRYDSNCK